MSEEGNNNLKDLESKIDAIFDMTQASFKISNENFEALNNHITRLDEKISLLDKKVSNLHNETNNTVTKGFEEVKFELTKIQTATSYQDLFDNNLKVSKK